MLLTCYKRFCRIYIILTLTLIGSNQAGLKIRIQALDSNGRESSLLYDGGSVVITCWYTNHSTTHKMGTPQILVENGTVDGNFTQLATGNGTVLQHDISINPSILGNKYRCHGGGLESAVIQILYVLCSPVSMKPRRICSKPHEFCHMTAAGSMECKRLAVNACFYGLRHYHSDSKIRSAVNVLPVFKVVCPNYYLENEDIDNDFGLCYSLTNQGRISHKDLGFLATEDLREEVCERAFGADIYKGSGCEGVREEIAMNGWSYRDLDHTFSICVYVFSDYDVLNATCSVGDGRGTVIESGKVRLTDNKTVAKMFGSTEDMGHLATPLIVDIVCTSWYNDEPILQYQTNLLLFRSGKDLKWKISEEKMAVSDNKVIYQFTVNVTAADGLYMCVKEWKEDEGRSCRLAATSNTQNLTTVVPFTLGEDNYTISFYIGLFASSPKKKYVLIHEMIANHTICSPSEKTNVVSTIGARNASIITGADRWKVVALAGLVVAIVAAVMALVAITVMVILWRKLRSNAGRCSSLAKEKGPPDPELKKEHIIKSMPTNSGTKSRSLKLSDPKK